MGYNLSQLNGNSFLDAGMLTGEPLHFRLDDINPATIYGGTWEKIGEGRTLIQSGTNYSLGSEGGSANAVLLEHDHYMYNAGAKSDTSSSVIIGAYGFNGGNSMYPIGTYGASYTSKAGVGESGVGKNMPPPYLAVNIWRRIVAA